MVQFCGSKKQVQRTKLWTRRCIHPGNVIAGKEDSITHTLATSVCAMLLLSLEDSLVRGKQRCVVVERMKVLSVVGRIRG